MVAVGSLIIILLRRLGGQSATPDWSRLPVLRRKRPRRSVVVVGYTIIPYEHRCARSACGGGGKMAFWRKG